MPPRRPRPRGPRRGPPRPHHPPRPHRPRGPRVIAPRRLRGPLPVLLGIGCSLGLLCAVGGILLGVIGAR